MLRRYFYILCIWYFRTLCDRHGEGLFSVILKKKKDSTWYIYSGISFSDILQPRNMKIKFCVPFILHRWNVWNSKMWDSLFSCNELWQQKQRLLERLEPKLSLQRSDILMIFLTFFSSKLAEKIDDFSPLISGWTKSIPSFKRRIRYYLWISDCLAIEISSNIKQYISWKEFNNYFSLACGNNGQFWSCR